MDKNGLNVIYTSKNGILWVDDYGYFRASYKNIEINMLRIYIETTNFSDLMKGTLQESFKVNELSKEQREAITSTIKLRDVDIYFGTCYLRAIPHGKIHVST